VVSFAAIPNADLPATAVEVPNLTEGRSPTAVAEDGTG